ncbi:MULTISPECIES: PhoH family protein [Nitrosomonas]|uniref:PhoH-like ATPase n=1 Tax=Nitrosomonas communis TaxID=44574 RepID=A0A0F7KIU4_9PROT|nr:MULTISPECIES: PhoH family protein [Nitrosomonas]AKH38854.1 phosphate starvation protein PhoH [Nitrosomonas communis]TYP88245.1 PhoH-like ATPase [Nitrosomonas communis]UVS60977.1 PhoH family protein [Nitrosomonas sp. PLL12]
MAKRAKKIYVLDTSVLLFDHNSIKNFEENDVAIPITSLEELDRFKVGNETKNFEAREAIRFLDKLSGNYGLNNWIALGTKKGKLKIVMSNLVNGMDAEEIYGKGKNDHKIINAALTLAHSEKSAKVILVTKDINLRLKAKAIGLPSEDYETGKVKNVKNISTSFPVIEDISSNMINELFRKGSINAGDLLGKHKIANGYYILKNGSDSVLARYNEALDTIERVEKTYVYNIKPRNAEQAFAVNALLNDHIKLVALQGVAGTGKTLLALASALEQKNKYDQIILARPIIPLSNREIGFLPGSAEDKISPYMQPLWDNLKYIKSQFRTTEKKARILDDMEESGKLSITALAFIRGRSLSNIMFIIDEAQNLTPHEVKTIITRAGEGTKVVFTGDINQIDTPYMDEQSNGLTYLIDRLKGHPLFAHIRLEKGERSALANLANEML